MFLALFEQLDSYKILVDGWDDYSRHYSKAPTPQAIEMSRRILNRLAINSVIFAKSKKYQVLMRVCSGNGHIEITFGFRDLTNSLPMMYSINENGDWQLRTSDNKSQPVESGRLVQEYFPDDWEKMNQNGDGTVEIKRETFESIARTAIDNS